MPVHPANRTTIIINLETDRKELVFFINLPFSSLMNYERVGGGTSSLGCLDLPLSLL